MKKKVDIRISVPEKVLEEIRKERCYSADGMSFELILLRLGTQPRQFHATLRSRVSTVPPEPEKPSIASEYRDSVRSGYDVATGEYMHGNRWMENCKNIKELPSTIQELASELVHQSIQVVGLHDTAEAISRRVLNAALTSLTLWLKDSSISSYDVSVLAEYINSPFKKEKIHE